MRPIQVFSELREAANRLLAAARSKPYFAVTGVLLGSIISTLSGRITVFGLADIRGAVHAGFDEGAWITTAFTVAQMVIVLPSVYLGAVFGARKVLLVGCAIYTVSSFALPFSQQLGELIFWQIIGGLSSGTFIPLTISVILKTVKWQFVPFGIALYAMNSELSQNISASLEGWFADNLSWKWIFWDNGLLAPIMMLCLWLGLQREPINRALAHNTAWSGILFASAGFGLVYAALDQGNRLDWFNSGLISGLMLGGTILIGAFVLHESLAKSPAVNLRFVTRGNMPLLAMLVALFRFVILSTAYIIPQYTTTVQGFRGLDTGHILLWIALPQFLLAPIAGVTLRRVDARIPTAIGFALIGLASYMASGLTSDWASDDFLPSQIIQAIGQSFAFTSLVYFSVRNLNLGEVLSFGALLQTARLFGGELGNGVMQTFVRIREQIHSNLLGLHVTTGSFLTDSRIQEYSQAVTPKSSGADEASARAVALLNRAVQIQADVLAYIDGFRLLVWAVALAVVMVLLLRPAPPSPFAVQNAKTSEPPGIAAR